MIVDLRVGGSNYGTVTAVAESGNVYSWGYNKNSEVGDVTTAESKTRPVLIHTIE